MGARWGWRWRRMAADGGFAATLERAKVPAESRRLHLARHRRGPRTRARAWYCRGRLARRRLSAAGKCGRCHRRPDCGALHPRTPAVSILSGFADVSLAQVALVGFVALFAS